jgi:hypothetical protein
MHARPLHLEIQTHRGKPCGVIRSTFRENGKVKHTSHGRISGVPLNTLKLIQAAFRGDVILKEDPDALSLMGSKEYGASRALLAVAEDIGLPRAIYSRREPWVRDCLAMIVGRVIYAGSKLSLSSPLQKFAHVFFKLPASDTVFRRIESACVRSVRSGQCG